MLLAARRAGKLKQIAEALESQGAAAAYYGVDLANADEVTAMAERIKSEHGVPDIIVNNAGSGRWLSTAETSLEEARQMIELPYLAAFYVTRMFLPEMIARGQGHIACVTSPASYIVWPNACAYGASAKPFSASHSALSVEMRGGGDRRGDRARARKRGETVVFQSAVLAQPWTVTVQPPATA